MSRKSGIIGIAGTLLLRMIELSIGEGFILTKRGMRKFSRELALNSGQLNSAIQTLSRKGLIAKNDSGYLITSKALRQKKILKIENEDWLTKKKWSGKWQLVIFDIPEKMRSERNIFRSFLKRKGFTKLQNSVFISPFADIEALDTIRRELKITNFVILLEARTSQVQNDSALRKKYSL